MNLSIFNKWLFSINEDIKLKNRKILLILDNATVHPVDREYSNIEIIFFLKNVTSLIQPCDQGIIKNFKDHYKKFLNRKFFFELDDQNNTNISNTYVKKNSIFMIL
ncbi:Tigger transposable element-derived protein 6 [Dictyocoela muelleri]|nr:Tigger transposable element-derived protein 6 [Dictyocoela muelleri]